MFTQDPARFMATTRHKSKTSKQTHKWGGEGGRGMRLRGNHKTREHKGYNMTPYWLRHYWLDGFVQARPTW